MQPLFLAPGLSYMSLSNPEWQQALYRPPEISIFPPEASLAVFVVKKVKQKYDSRHHFHSYKPICSSLSIWSGPHKFSLCGQSY